MVLSSQSKQQGLGFTLAGWKASQETSVLWVDRDAPRILTWLLDGILGSLSQLLILPRGSLVHRLRKMCRVHVWLAHCAFQSGGPQAVLGHDGS